MDADSERDYLDEVRRGDTSRKLGAVRQLQDELEAIRMSARRLAKVFEIVEDNEGVKAANYILRYTTIAESCQSLAKHELKVQLMDERAS